MYTFRRARIVLSITCALVLLAWPQRSLAFIEAAYSLGRVCNDATNIVVLQVEKVDKERNLIIYRKVEDLKGTHDTQVIRHNIGKQKLHNDREWSVTMDWAQPGKKAVMFHNGNQSETCIGTYWYQTYRGGDWWTQTHGEPFLLRSYCGKVDKLIAALKEMHTQREVVVPCMVGASGPPGTEQCRGPKPTAEESAKLQMGTARIQRMKASLKLMDYDARRDFVGWGDEEYRRLNGMPGFTHYSALPRVDPEAQAISVVDFDNDGRPDLCLVGGSRLVLVGNGEEAMTEVPLPLNGGARAAVWADYNGDGLPDLLLATPTGPRLFTNLGKGRFRDDSHVLPREVGYNLTAAAWIDYDGDGRPDILLGNGFHGLRLYRNTGAVNKPLPPPATGKGQPSVPAITWSFEDVSSKVGLGPDGLGSTIKGDTLTVCDVNGDGRPDILYGAGTGLLLLNTPQGFVEAKDCGIKYRAGKVGPVFGDFDNSGAPSLLVPQLAGGCKLFKNDGKGHFTEVTAQAGDLAKFTGIATCAAWGDLDNDGHLDLVVGCLRGPNRVFRNKGNGMFEDITEALGLDQRIFNTQAIALVDVNQRGVLDLVFNNEGQESCILVSNQRQAAGKLTPLTLAVKGTTGVVGSRVRVRDPAGKTVATRQIGGGAGRGGQEAPLARFALKPGAYRFEVQYSSGAVRSREITVADAPLRTAIND